MQLHLVGGFLGSGKTTAIAGIAKLLLARGWRVGVITNDQGKYLVDTAFFRLADVPAVEVTGGCFCCNYDDLDARLDSLIAQAQPDVIFAESVGSCADVVATVVKPLFALRAAQASLSVFADARLLRRRLLDLPMPFSEDIVYIFDQQIAEAGLLVINKRDLLTPRDLGELEALVRERYPGKPYRVQDSRVESDLNGWLALLESGGIPVPSEPLAIDYERYGAGETELGWLNAAFTLSVGPGMGRAVAVDVLAAVIAAVRARDLPIGHLKFVVEGSDSGAVKISISTLDEGDWAVPDLAGEQVRVLVNARVQADAALLRELVQGAVGARAEALGIGWSAGESEAFQPAPLKPTHRYH